MLVLAEGARPPPASLDLRPFFLCVVYVYRIYCSGMKTPITPESLLQELAQIQSLERGTVSVLRQGPSGPYYNHQCYEHGRNVSRYVPADQVAELQAALADHQRFQELVQQYVELLVARTRAQRQAGSKKKSPHPTSSSPKTRKSTS